MTINNSENLLKGQTLVLETSPPGRAYRSWIEITLHEDDIPDYPLRNPLYSMIWFSPYRQAASTDSRFKLRTSSFNADDIEHEYDPSYEGVASYIEIKTLEQLVNHLNTLGARLEDFVESSTTDYPL